MAFKLILFFGLATIAAAGIIPLEHSVQQHVLYNAAPHVAHYNSPQRIVLQKQEANHEAYHDDPHPKYNFSYDVQDAVSGDSKSQTESRDGDIVQGEYSLDDADGFRRTVKYTADNINGFNAVVHREPLTHKIVATPVQFHQSPISKSSILYENIPTLHQQQSSYSTYGEQTHHH